MLFNAATISTAATMMGILLSLIFLLVGGSVLVLFHFCVGGGPLRWFFIPVVVQRRRTVSYNRPPIDLENIPCYDMKADERGSNSPTDCVVCLEHLKVGEQCRLLPRCNHIFHSQCIDSWLLKTPNCPICRTSVSSEKGCNVSGEGSSDQSGVEVEFELRENQEIAGDGRSSSSPGPSHNSSSESAH